MTDAANTPIWLISGCSSGFGRELARGVLARGWRAVVTARDPMQVADIVAMAPDRALAVALDVRDKAGVAATIQAAEQRFGGIDVLVNNAGYGYQSSVEEADEAMVRDMFETNFFGLVRLTKAVLPIFRRQRSGHIFNIGSVAGVVGVPSGGYYAATKHAVEGFSESLAGEVGALGIAVTVVEPGPFRTDFGGRSFKATPSIIEDYSQTVGTLMAMARAQAGNQPGDPSRAAEAILDAYAGEDKPRNLVLGRLTVDRVEQKFRSRLEELERWRAISVAADFPS